MPLTLEDLYPPLAVRITCGPLELRGIDDADVVALCELAERGIHTRDWTPFSFPWTDAPPGELAGNTAQHYWRKRAEFSVESWSLYLAVRHEGTVVGMQEVGTSDYLVTRTGETGSWLGLEHQGKGIGTLMRQAICAFAFDELDAAELTSAAFVDNRASLAVSRKVGYRPNGQVRLARRGRLVLNQRLVLTPDTFVRGPRITVEGADSFRRAIGLDAAKEQTDE